MKFVKIAFPGVADLIDENEDKISERKENAAAEANV